jgi:hypothetical protein
VRVPELERGRRHQAPDDGVTSVAETTTRHWHRLARRPFGDEQFCQIRDLAVGHARIARAASW